MISCFSFEMYKDKEGKKMVYIENDDNNGCGENFPYENEKDLGKTIAGYLADNYADMVDDPDYNPEHDEEEES